MKEYIEREAMIAKIEEVYCAKCEDDHCDYRRVPPEPCVIEDVVNWIDIQPAADVVERKRGHWIDGADQFGAKRGEYRVCSFCNTCFPRDDRIVPPSMWQCCPNCFTDMRSHHDSLCDQTEEG